MGRFHGDWERFLVLGWAFSTIGAAAISLRDEACAYYPDSDFGRKYGGFVYDHPWPKGR